MSPAEKIVVAAFTLFFQFAIFFAVVKIGARNCVVPGSCRKVLSDCVGSKFPRRRAKWDRRALALGKLIACGFSSSAGDLIGVADVRRPIGPERWEGSGTGLIGGTVGSIIDGGFRS